MKNIEKANPKYNAEGATVIIDKQKILRRSNSSFLAGGMGVGFIGKGIIDYFYSKSTGERGTAIVTAIVGGVLILGAFMAHPTKEEMQSLTQ